MKKETLILISVIALLLAVVEMTNEQTSTGLPKIGNYNNESLNRIP